MVSSIIVFGALLGGALNALRGGRRNHDLITHRPYNNPYSDATAARDERAMLG